MASIGNLWPSYYSIIRWLLLAVDLIIDVMRFSYRWRGPTRTPFGMHVRISLFPAGFSPMKTNLFLLYNLREIHVDPAKWLTYGYCIVLIWSNCNRNALIPLSSTSEKSKQKKQRRGNRLHYIANARPIRRSNRQVWPVSISGKNKIPELRRARAILF